MYSADLLRKVINTDVPGVLDVVEELVMQGRDLTQLTAEFYMVFKELASREKHLII